MTPASRLKDRWRAMRLPGESLRAFARRIAAYSDTNATSWLIAKGIPLPTLEWSP